MGVTPDFRGAPITPYGPCWPSPAPSALVVHLGRSAVLPELMSFRAFIASSMVLTLTRVSPLGVSLAAAAQLSLGVRKYWAPFSRAPIVFSSMPPIGPTVPAVVDGAGAGHERAAGEVARVSLSTMPVNISPALGPPTSASLMSMLNGNVRRFLAEMPTMARDAPLSLDFAVVMVTSVVGGGRLARLLGGGLLLGGHHREDDLLAGLVLGDQLATSSGALTAVPSTLLITSPAQPALGRGALDDGRHDHPGLHRDAQLLQSGHLGALLGLAELLGVLALDLAARSCRPGRACRAARPCSSCASHPYTALTRFML